ncbi:YqaE/Pmp3 family membrane protein [Halovibrio sp. HP20-50]|uniref:YqaE/Pmp3 family membrane protein n=1 Tax=Halovibrio sp. HP20-59 TaxID=3080275 RepID=UPI00294ADB5B|nr:YqaE/Pmp3 family membrane protein [Halovibrio sp. HP20-59]MEA2119903.1 YqaE/Pmp3 family membrane protein [Halovibrio sp. HP20-59]
MDAREYLNRKGVGVDREPDRPNTLEEKAWERARGSGHQRPKSGTPHDWEEWERYHGDLAEGAETLDQKIDKEAHRTQARGEKAAPQADPVEHFTPPPTTPSETPSAGVEIKPPEPPAGLKIAYFTLAILLPPLAVALTDGGTRRVIISAVLTLLGWLPGIVYAVWWLQRR